MKYLIFIVLFLVVFAVPVGAQEDNEWLNGWTAGERAAKERFEESKWQAIGCVGGILGIGLAYMQEPIIPPIGIMGKSPTYIAAYTESFRTTTQNLQARKATEGCVFGTVVSLLIFFAYIGSMESQF